MTTAPSPVLSPRRYFSVIVGEDCNARCAFCIAPETVKKAAEPFPVERAVEAARLAAAAGAAVASVSGGGEPLMLALKNRPAFTALTDSLADLFPKRDLHSNYAVPAAVRKTSLYPAYTHLTVSLWPNAEVNRTYLGTSTFDRTVDLLRQEVTQQSPRSLRLSATLGTDWMQSIDDLYAYAEFAKSVGATAITLRPLVTPPHGDADAAEWISRRRLDGKIVAGWLHAAATPVQSTTVRDADVFDIDGVATCIYRYAIEDHALDEDFYYFRPSTATGRYGLFTDYHEDLTPLAREVAA